MNALRFYRFRLVVLGFASLVAGCGYSVFVKEQAGEFAKAASDVIAVLDALPSRAKAAETNLTNTLQALDPNCAPADGHIVTLLHPIPQGQDLTELIHDSTCRRNWDVLRTCESGHACDLHCAAEDSECAHVQELAKVARWCAAPGLVKKLNLSCASGAVFAQWDFPTQQDSRQQKAYAEFSALAKAAAEYVTSLSDFAVARDKSSQKHVKTAIDDLKNAADKVSNAISGHDSKIDEKEQTAAQNLLSLLVQMAKEAEDEQHIRDQVAKYGATFESDLLELSNSADFLQAYIPAVTRAQLATIRASYQADAPRMSTPDRDWYLSRLSDTQTKIDAFDKEKPVSAALQTVAKAHENLRRILAGNLTKEEEQAVFRENIQEFVRLFKALKAAYELI